VATIQQANKEIKGYAAEYTLLASQVEFLVNGG
jgi:hypothetical protein